MTPAISCDRIQSSGGAYTWRVCRDTASMRGEEGCRASVPGAEEVCVCEVCVWGGGEGHNSCSSHTLLLVKHSLQTNGM